MMWTFFHKNKQDKIAAWLKRGNALYIKQDFSKAKKFYQKILAYDADHYAATLNLAVCFFETGEYKKSIPLLQSALKMNAKEAWTHNYLSQIFQKQGAHSKALDEAFAAVETSGGDDNHHLNFSYALYEATEEKGKDFVLPYLEKWQKKYPENFIVSQTCSALFSDEKRTRCPWKYVEKLFDVFAPDFETVLKALEYDSPKSLAKMLADEKSLKTKENPKGLDLGCGTGLCGSSIKKQNKKCLLTGVDISAEMLRLAKQKNIYQNLIKDDIERYLESEKKDQFDFVTAADVLTYFGELNFIIKGVQKVLKKRGLFAFSFTTNFLNQKGFVLTSSSRYVHAPEYVENTLQTAGFEILKNEPKVLRKEGKKDVIGRLVLALKK